MSMPLTAAALDEVALGTAEGSWIAGVAALPPPAPKADTERVTR